MASQAQVEANSLASITQLAAYPPKYPRNPTETKRPSLVLYIARVPGKRDVILTTLKPRVKNVTAEDVASSLYYFHLDTPEDGAVREELQRAQAEEELDRPVASVPATPILRKPVAPSVRSMDPLSRSSSIRGTPPRVSIDGDQNASAPDTLIHDSNASAVKTGHWHPEIREALDALEGRTPEVPARIDSINRKPTSRTQVPGAENQNPRASMPVYSSKPTSNSADFTTAAARLSMMNMPPPPKPKTEILTGIPVQAGIPLPSGGKIPQSFSITIIRRDPGSGAQWNIGSIRSQPMLGLAGAKTTSLSANPESQYNDISVLLTTPGYARFPKTESTDHISEDFTNETQSQESRNPNSGFARHVRMEWTRPRSPVSRSAHFQRQESSNTTLSTFQTRARSIGDAAVLQAKNITVPHSIDTSRTSKPRPKGYTFNSPWGGRCDFLTGTDGRSLKCKHTLPSATSNVNPMASSNQTSAAVSELRFNLPSSVVAQSPVSPSGGNGDFARATASKLGHLRNKISSDFPRSSKQKNADSSYAARFDSDDDDEDRFGLRLGQEKAGGGNRGKRAKLGKLIIHDEGLKMLDILVAANMGVWWGTWER